MTCKYCADYIRRALKEVPNFEKSCVALGFNHKKDSDREKIVRHLGAIGQFGTIRLARSFPDITDEETFRMIAETGLHFYWMTLDFWEEKRAEELKKRTAGKS